MRARESSLIFCLKNQCTDFYTFNFLMLVSKVLIVNAKMITADLLTRQTLQTEKGDYYQT